MTGKTEKTLKSLSVLQATAQSMENIIGQPWKPTLLSDHSDQTLETISSDQP